jgi:hypothetical protein
MVIDAQHLNLRGRPEVSELSTVGEVSVPLTATVTVTIPALTVRRAETSVELGSGESFALAGLLQHTSSSSSPRSHKSAIFQSSARCSARTASSAARPTSSSSSPRISCSQCRRVLRPRPTAYSCRTMRSECFLSDKYRQGLQGPARGPLNAGGRGLIGPGGFRLD